jgi:TFIIF-interacting CTD phosphatase-like protein
MLAPLAAVVRALLQSRLRSGRKLSLVLDLDHTLIHTTSDPEVARLATTHPSLRCRDDVHVFHDSRAVFTVKLRPHARAFLSQVRRCMREWALHPLS